MLITEVIYISANALKFGWARLAQQDGGEGRHTHWLILSGPVWLMERRLLLSSALLLHLRRVYAKCCRPFGPRKSHGWLRAGEGHTSSTGHTAAPTSIHTHTHTLSHIGTLTSPGKQQDLRDVITDF